MLELAMELNFHHDRPVATALCRRAPGHDIATAPRQRGGYNIHESAVI